MGKTLASVPPVTIFTGSVDPVAATAAIKMMAMDLNLAGPATTALNFAKTTNPFVGVYQGTHSDTAPGPAEHLHIRREHRQLRARFYDVPETEAGRHPTNAPS